MSKRSLGDNGKTFVNMLLALCTFFTRAGIGFVLTPFVMSTLGVEAYGFVTLSNTMADYVAIVTVAVTSMVSRFIALAYFRGDKSEAKTYYSSTIATLLICIVLVVVPSLICVVLIDSLLDISPNLVNDVRVLMLFVIANFSVSLMSSNLSIGFYIKNKLYIGSTVNAIGYVIRALLMVLLFSVLPAHVWFVGAATFLATSAVQLLYMRWKRRLIPDLVFSASSVRLGHAVEVMRSGIWNSITQVGSVLSSSLDVLVANLMLGAAPMGVLSVSKVIPQSMGSIGSAVASAFQPTLTRLYAARDIDGLVARIKLSMSCMGLVIALPIGAFLAFGIDFLRLWVPSQDSQLLFVLSALPIGMWVVAGPAAIVENVFTILNKIKVNSLLICVSGFVVVAAEVVLLNVTDLGLYAIVATSFAERILRGLVYAVPACARYLGRPWWEFFPSVGKCVVSVAIVALCCSMIRWIAPPDDWASLICCGLVGVAVGALACSCILFGAEERKKVVKTLLVRLGWRNG